MQLGYEDPEELRKRHMMHEQENSNRHFEDLNPDLGPDWAGSAQGYSPSNHGVH